MTWRFSHHARMRVRQMGLEEGDVLQALSHPDVDYVSHARYGEHSRIAKKGDISVAYDSSTSTIITVLWNTQKEYAR